MKSSTLYNKSLAQKLHMAEYFIHGVKRIVRNKQLMLLALLFTLIMAIWFINVGIIFRLPIVVFYALGLSLFILANSLFWKNIQIQKGFHSIHFCNKEGEFPYVISRKRSNQGYIISLKSEGVPLDVYQDYWKTLENVFNITIFDVYIKRRQDLIYVQYCEGVYDFYITKDFDFNILDDKSDNITLGENGMGRISFSFSQEAHVIAGGCTGSGKTCLTKVILVQCIAKGYRTILCDFKFGVDFSYPIRKRCSFITNMEDLHKTLCSVQKEMNTRLDWLAEYECRNISKYNDVKDDCDKLERIVIFIEEVADVIDNKYLSKEDKELGTQVIGLINDIARKGRAAGCHLYLSTQRPDAVVLPNTIKNNALYKICGRADKNLSMIVLESTDAAERIPMNTTGVFLDSNGQLFKSYYIDEYAEESIFKDYFEDD